ncbi:MAG: restriction endonuclease subunit S [Bacteroidetes bacterium]|nr:restriction endonuclease subunit S [Bacteroidota bacterium]
MNAALLLAHFHRLGGTPDAVPRLRRFVLDLAVIGKLVEQDPKDEPAIELHNRIIGGSAVDTSKNRELPNGWCLTSLISLGSWAIGNGFPKSEQGESNGPFHFVKVSDMNLPGNEKYIRSTNNTIDEVAVPRIKARIHPVGTIIFPKIGGAIATNKRRILTKQSAIDNNCLGITFSDELNLEWAYVLLTSLDFTQYQVGTAVPALQQSVLGEIQVRLPPLPEQHRIVAKVDELMAVCDRLEAAQQQRESHRTRLTAATWQQLVADPEPQAARFALKQLPALTTRKEQIPALRQAILDLAVRGKLVQQDEKDEPASVLLERIAKEKERLVKAGKYRRRRALPEINNELSPFQIPHHWAWSMLGAVTTITQGFAFSSGDFTRASKEGMPLIKISNIGSNSPDVYVRGEPDSEYVVQPGELLLGLSGSIKCAIWNGPPALLNQRIARITPVPNGFHKQWLLYCVKKAIAVWIEETSKLTVQNVKDAQLYQAYVPVPPLAEQHRIVAKVDELMALCDRLEAALEKGETAKAGMLEALLHLGPAATPTPPQVRQKPAAPTAKPRKKATYPEPAEALPLAAEPEARKAGDPSKPEQAILGFLQVHPGWHGKSAILQGSVVATNRWNAAIKSLLESGAVVRQGEKKGARYRIV